MNSQLGSGNDRTIGIGLKNIQSCILQNGHLSESFTLQRGCRQGDPISPYIFILCVEILGIMIRNDRNMQGIKINNK